MERGDTKSFWNGENDEVTNIELPEPEDSECESEQEEKNCFFIHSISDRSGRQANHM